MKKTYHRLLKRQIKKAGLKPVDIIKLEKFLDQINQAYLDSDLDMERLETILEQSSKELYSLNQELKSDVADKISEVEAARDKIQLINNNVRNGIFRLNKNAEFIYLNNAWEDLFGISVEDSLGKKIWAFADYIDAKNLDEVAKFIENPSKDFNTVFKVTNKNGSVKFLETNFRLIFEDNEEEAVGAIGSFLDITELNTTKNRLQLVLDNIQHAIFELDADLKFIYINEAFSTLYNINVNDIMHLDIRHILPRIDKESVVAFNAFINSTENQFSKIFQIKRKSGIYQWFEVKIKLDRNEEGNILGGMGVFIDITELNSIKSQLSLLLDNVNHAIFEFNDELRFTYLNAAFELYYETNVEKALNLKFEEFFKYLELNSHQKISEFLVSNDLIHNQVLKLTTKSGRKLWIDLTIKVTRDLNNNILSGSGAFVDVTELQETKDQLEVVVGNVENVIFQTDSKGKYTYLNAAWEDLVGLKIEDSIGKTFYELFDHIDKESQQAVFEFLNNPVGQFRRVIKGITNDGKQKWVENRFQISYDKNGQPTGTVGSFIDVTQLKETQLQLQAAKEEAELANEAKSKFLNVMSHEIRTPLNGIIGLSNILILEDHLDSQTENLNALKYSSEHLLHLVNDVLDYNKILAGKIELESKDFNLDYILGALRKNFQPLAIEKGIRFKVKKDEDIPMALIGDRTRLFQILNNLVSNAIKFTNTGKVELSLELIHQHRDKCTILFEVIDTGEGIAEESQSKIFDDFVQADSSITRKFGGTGLGLSICKRLLNIMGSDLQLESKVGKGSNFSFEVDYEISQAYNKEDNIESVDLNSSFSGLENLNILIADDYSMNVMVLKRFLKKWGCTFDVAKNGEEALKLHDQCEYAIILMDLQMPTMDGFEATKSIRNLKSNKSNIPIIALTATNQSEIKDQALKAGVDAFVSKPFNPIHLFNTMKSVLNAVPIANQLAN